MKSKPEALSFKHWRTARAIFGLLLISALAACSSNPSVPVVFPTTDMEHAKETAPEKNTPVAAPSAPVAAHMVESATDPKPEASKSKSVDTGKYVAGSYVEPKPIKASKPAPVAPALHTTGRKPASLIENLPLAEAPPITPPPTGSAAYYIPRQMVQKEPSLVDLWIDRNTSVEQLKQELAAQLKITNDKINVRRVQDKDKKPGTTVLAQLDGAEIPIGASMVAQLRGGEDFSIEPKEPQHRSLQGTNRAKWNWRVTPKHPSETGILIDLDIWIDPGSGKPWNESYHESVIVRAPPEPLIDKIKRLLQELNIWLAIFGIGGVGGVIKWLMSRRNSSGNTK